MNTSKSKLVLCALIALVVGLVACGPTYVTQNPNAVGYDSTYYQPVYVPSMPLVIYNGQSGYYDTYHHFHVSVTVNGAQGYYDGNRFVSSSPSVQAAVTSHKPFYAGASNNTTVVNNTTVNKGNPYGLQGGMGRGNSAAAPAAPITGKPAYGSAVAPPTNTPASGMSRGGFSPPSAPSAPPSGMGRGSFSAPASRPSMPSSGMGRRK